MTELRNYEVLAPRNYAEYLKTPEGERWEIINGVPYYMTPAPTSLHQFVVSNLLSEFVVYLKGKQCRAVGSPFDVLLFATGKNDNEITTVVQPDLSIICDPSKIDKRGCNGAPDLVVEVLSPSSLKRDKVEKLSLYRKAKVQEYWIVDIEHEMIEVYRFHDDPDTFPDIQQYSTKTNPIAPVGIFEDLQINLNDVFA